MGKELTTKVQPLADRILVKRSEPEKVSSGGIIIPPTATEKSTEAEVIAVGPGKVLENGSRLEPSVKVGDRILFGKYDGNEIQIDGEPHLILRESDILAVLD